MSVAQKNKDTAFVYIMKRTQENDKLHVIRQRMEKYKKPINNGNAGVQYFVKDIFYLLMDVVSFFNQEKETAEVQQIAE